MTAPIDLAVNHALNDLRATRARELLLHGGGGLDGKRPTAWCDYGFPAAIEFQQLYQLYARGGIANGAVNKLVGHCWKTSPWVIEGDEQDGAREVTAWENRAKPLLGSARFWRVIAEADRRRLIGRYSGLLLSFGDNKKWDQPVAGRSNRVVKFTPAWAGSLVPASYESDPNSLRFGEPAMWRYRQSSFGNTVGLDVEVHPDRVFIFGDWRSDCIGFLDPAYNNFVSIEKVEGGSAESFLKNAARQLSVSFDKEVNLSSIAAMYGVTMDELHSKFNEAARDVNSGLDMMLINQGATVSPLTSSVPDPTPAYNVNLQSAAAALDIPTKILVGMQTGERASSEDQKYFNARCQARRVSELSFEIHDLVVHLMRFGAIPDVGEFAVMWDDLNESTDSERLANSKTMAEINQVLIGTGEAVFTADEIREAAGFDPVEDPLGENEDDEDPAADPTE